VSVSQSIVAPPNPDPNVPQWTELRHWTDAELSAMGVRVSASVENWCRDWLVRQDFWEQPSVRAGAVRLAESRLSDAQVILPVGPAGADANPSVPQVWIGFPAASSGSRMQSAAQLALTMVFGAEARAKADSLALQSATAALDDLGQILSSMAGMSAVSTILSETASLAPLPDAVWGRWAGAVQFLLPARCGFAIYVNGAAAANLIGSGNVKRPARRSGNLTPIQDATAAATMALQVRLNAVELTFGQLKSLNLGDVIVLRHPIAEPLDVFAPADTRVCKAYLGRSGGRRAVQAVRCQSAAEDPSAQ
jgi:hypothetical protein